jgi:hypothetical protein
MIFHGGGGRLKGNRRRFNARMVGTRPVRFWEKLFENYF